MARCIGCGGSGYMSVLFRETPDHRWVPWDGEGQPALRLAAVRCICKAGNYSASPESSAAAIAFDKQKQKAVEWAKAEGVDASEAVAWYLYLEAFRVLAGGSVLRKQRRRLEDYAVWITRVRDALRMQEEIGPAAAIKKLLGQVGGAYELTGSWASRKDAQLRPGLR